MNNPFSKFTQVDAIAPASRTKYNPEEMPNFSGIFNRIQAIEWQGQTFERLIFTNVTNADTGATIEGELSVKDYAMLKSKVRNHAGRYLGISYEGLKKHPKDPLKTIQTFAVYLIDEQPTQSTQDESDNLPF